MAITTESSLVLKSGLIEVIRIHQRYFSLDSEDKKETLKYLRSWLESEETMLK